MAETDTPAEGGSAPAAQQPAPPRLRVLTQYVRDLSFENYAAQEGRMEAVSKPEIKVTVNIDAGNRGQDRYEVMLKLNVEAKQGEERFALHGSLYLIAGEALGGIKDVKALGREEEFLRRFSRP
ncbi:MAG: protein-export chaperone SecB, partial [Pseudomonadota bacterium]